MKNPFIIMPRGRRDVWCQLTEPLETGSVTECLRRDTLLMHPTAAVHMSLSTKDILLNVLVTSTDRDDLIKWPIPFSTTCLTPGARRDPLAPQ